MNNAFERLGISPTASRDEIRAAYHELAKRWHPDRFMAGPERDWANEKMAEINSAYRECLDGTALKRSTDSDTQNDAEALQRVRVLVEEGNTDEAGSLLRNMALRTAEWNWLFGRVLLAQNRREKAVMYLKIACHQKPENREYRETLHKVETEDNIGFLQKLRRISKH